MGLSKTEIGAAKFLRPYLSKDPVIVDVGSNKGEWAEILASSCKEVHLFEPNEVLLHYSMVKFEGLTNIHYYNYALFSKSGEMDFFYFTNTNNGLSSVFKNQIWIDMGLPMKFGKVNTHPLDSIFDGQMIDLLKIDVEGADYDVLKGAESLLKRKLIKFIQIEHSDHLRLSGHTWNDVLTLVRKYGYEVYDFNGGFIKAEEPFTQENYYIMAEITQNWNSEFIKNTEQLKKSLEFVLEIGCFEGLTTRYICDELLKPGGRMIAIDPLTDEYLTTGDEQAKAINSECEGMFTGQYGRFIRNTQDYPVELLRMTSREALTKKGFIHYRFDLIYVDGDHRSQEVYNDGLIAFEICRKGGWILFDDYGWRQDTADGIEKFLSEYRDYIEVIVRGYQILVQKLDNNPNPSWAHLYELD